MVRLENISNVYIITIERDKVNALDLGTISDLHQTFLKAEEDTNSSSIIIQGSGSFFSFGLDIPSLLESNREEVKNVVNLLLKLCKDIYLSDKITISSLNGHATGAGCMIAISTDYRFMTKERAKIALNEINIGLSLFPSTVNILKSIVGDNNAKKFLLGGEMTDSKSALHIGLIDRIYDKEDLYKSTLNFAKTFTNKSKRAISLMKKDLRLNQILYLDNDDSIEAFLDIFYSSETQKILKAIEIRK